LKNDCVWFYWQVVLPDLMGEAAVSAEPERAQVHTWVESEAPHQLERYLILSGNPSNRNNSLSSAQSDFFSIH
jgi:hypothetical protein